MSRRRVSHWQGECNDWRDVPGWAEAMDGEKWVAEAMYLADFEHGEAAQRLALWERLAEQAYHQIGAANGDVLAVRDVTEHSWHASEPLNRQSCGWALDCHHSEPLDEWMVETGKASLRALIHRMRQAQDDAESWPVRVTGPGKGVRAPILIRPHRANDSQRRVDPQGNHERGVWRDVVVPVVESEPDAEIDYEWSNAKRGGRPVPRVWDHLALYDWRGRKL